MADLDGNIKQPSPDRRMEVPPDNVLKLDKAGTTAQTPDKTINPSNIIAPDKTKLGDKIPSLKELAPIYISGDFTLSTRMKELQKLRRYVENDPPYPVLYKEDPDEEKSRVPVGVAGEIVQKRVGMLFGKSKFSGMDAFQFEDEEFGKWVEPIWDKNQMTKRFKSFHKSLLYAGFAAWKLVIDPQAPLAFRFNQIQPEHIFVEFNNTEDQTVHNVKTWIIMYQRENKTFYREEIRPDFSVVYEGKFLNERELQERHIDVLGITNPIEFIPVAVYGHELGMFPFIYLSRYGDGKTFWGDSLIQRIITRIDRINEIYTNALYAMRCQNDPTMVIRGSRKQELFKDSDAVWWFENKDASVQILTWEGINEPTFKVVRDLVDQCYKECDVPSVLMQSDVSISNISSYSLKLMFTDALNAVEGERDDYESLWRDMMILLAKAAVVTKQLAKPNPALQNVQWGEIIQPDPMEVVNSITSLYTTGLIDQETALKKLGYGDDEIQDIMDKMNQQAASENTPNDTDTQPTTWIDLNPDDQQTLTEHNITEEKWNAMTIDQQRPYLINLNWSLPTP